MVTAAQKYGTDAAGKWARDGNGLPCYDLAADRLPTCSPTLPHLIGTGRIALLADQYGGLRLLTADVGRPVSLNGPDYDSGPAFRLGFADDRNAAPFEFSAAPRETGPTVRWGIGHVAYRAGLEQKGVALTVDFLAPVGSPFFVVTVALVNTGSAKFARVLTVAADLAPWPADGFKQERHPFLRDGVALFADLHERLGDFFLAGATAWEAAASAVGLTLSVPVSVAAGESWCETLLVGYSPECSLEWLRQQREQHTPESVRASWAERLAPARIRAPELWMQEECLWNAGRLLAFEWRDSGQTPVIVPDVNAMGADLGNAAPFRSGGARIREILALTLALGEWAPDLALASLRAATAAQLRNGRCAETLGCKPAGDIDPAVERSDNEIWLLLAWAEFIGRWPERKALEGTCPFADGGQASVWEHLKLAYQWLRDEIRQGANGHIRMLAGDWCGYLNRVGAEGLGESVLNSAMACYALQRLADIARRRDEPRIAGDMAAWHQALRLAVGEAFDDNHFARAFTDAGRPVGGAAHPERVFNDVQAWAVLARCGSVDQRELALNAVVKRKRDDEAVPALNRPLPFPPPPDLTDRVLPWGDGWNAGIVMPVAAWLVWALAVEGRKEQALREWQLLTVRQRAAAGKDLHAAALGNVAGVSSHYAGRRQGGPGLRERLKAGIMPSAHAVAWQGFALRKALA